MGVTNKTLRERYNSFLEKKQSGLKEHAKAEVNALINEFSTSPNYDFVIWVCERCDHKLNHNIWKNIVLPTLKERLHDDPVAIRAMVETIQNLYSSKKDWEEFERITEMQLIVRLLEIDPENKWALSKRIELLQNWLRYSIHEWPSGVLYGSDGASLSECDQIIEAAGELQRLDTSGNSNALCKEVLEKTNIYKDRLIN